MLGAADLGMNMAKAPFKTFRLSAATVSLFIRCSWLEAI